MRDSEYEHDVKALKEYRMSEIEFDALYFSDDDDNREDS